jgi:hypothetical protein
MANQTINQVQRTFVQGSARQHIETVIRFKSLLDSYVDDYDNQQTPIAETADIINDNRDLTAPRDDAPNLTGNDLKTLRDLSQIMSNTLDTAYENDLISLAARPVSSIRRG